MPHACTFIHVYKHMCTCVAPPPPHATGAAVVRSHPGTAARRHRPGPHRHLIEPAGEHCHPSNRTVGPADALLSRRTVSQRPVSAARTRISLPFSTFGQGVLGPMPRRAGGVPSVGFKAQTKRSYNQSTLKHVLFSGGANNNYLKQAIIN